MPFGLAMISPALLPNTSARPASSELFEVVTSLTMVVAAVPEKFGLAPTVPPSVAVPDVRLLLWIRPLLPMS